MTRVFADTSFLVAAIGPRDSYHHRALEFARGYQGEVWTTEFVIVEFGNYLYRVKDRPFFEPVVRNIQQMRSIESLRRVPRYWSAAFNGLPIGRIKSGR